MKYVVLLAAFFLVACGGKKPPQVPLPEKEKPSDSAAPSTYFPVYDFMSSEIAYVDSLPVGIKKYTINGKHIDSSYIQIPEFNVLAAEFLPEALTDSLFTSHFKETSFFDNNAHTGTFFYSNNSATDELKRVDVVTEKTDTYDQVKSIFMEKNYQSGDTSIIKRLYWKTQRSFQIIIQKSLPSKEPSTEVIKVVWDNRD